MFIYLICYLYLPISVVFSSFFGHNVCLFLLVLGLELKSLLLILSSFLLSIFKAINFILRNSFITFHRFLSLLSAKYFLISSVIFFLSIRIIWKLVSYFKNIRELLVISPFILGLIPLWSGKKKTMWFQSLQMYWDWLYSPLKVPYTLLMYVHCALVWYSVLKILIKSGLLWIFFMSSISLCFFSACFFKHWVTWVQLSNYDCWSICLLTYGMFLLYGFWTNVISYIDIYDYSIFLMNWPFYS